MNEIYEHQKDIIDDDQKKCGLFLGTGAGKTRTALSLAGRHSILIIAPKIQVEDGNWKREMEKMGMTNAVEIISKETFRRDWKKISRFNTVIVDEAHTMCGVTPNVRWRKGKQEPKTSQLFEALDQYLKLRPPLRLYLLTATPARNAMAVWALSEFLGKKWNWTDYRRAFYIRIPMPGREVWQQKKDQATKERLAKCVKSLGYVGRLEDYFDVPEQTVKYVHCPLDDNQIRLIKELPLMFPDPLVLIGKTHQVENGFLIDDPYEEEGIFKTSKTEVIDDFIEEYRKILVFCRFRMQIDLLAAHMRNRNIKTFVLTGDTKDRDTIMAQAEKSDRCVFIAQSQISTGYELPSFRCTIFASASYSTVDNTQAMGRTLRANALNKNLYVYLYSGEIDKAVIECLKNHEDFNEKLYAKTRS